MDELSRDSLAIVLICSNLASTASENAAPYTTNQWNKLAVRLLQSPLKRPGAFFEWEAEEWRKALPLDEPEFERLRKLLARAGQIGIEIEQLRSQGIQITTRAEQNYPRRLKETLKQSSPPLLYYCGDLRIADGPAAAVVGSRSPDDRALEFASRLAARCISDGINIVSGGAKGIDSVAQEKALSAGGRVVSFLADGLAKRIKYRDVRDAIVAGRLLLLSLAHPNAGFTVYGAMDRNKYIYGLSDLAVVVSSDEGKGGTWAGAVEALKNGWVPVFVREDEGMPGGNKSLLAMGAKPMTWEILNHKSTSLMELSQDTANQPAKKPEQMRLVMDDTTDMIPAVTLNRQKTEVKCAPPLWVP